MRGGPLQRRLRIVRLYPVIGVVVLAILVAIVFVSYTANQGLPFQSTYDISARVPSADRLIKTDEVRIGGIRAGQVSSVSARLAAGGRAYAVIGLALTPSAGPLPVDTRVQVQSASVLGQTYVDLGPGSSSTKVRAGGTLPLRDAESTVELTDLLDIFNRSTATAIRRTIGNLSSGFAGRGSAVNDGLYSLARLLGPFTTLSRELAAPSTNLAGLLGGWESLASALSPVAPQLGGFVAGASTTFGALASVAPALGAAIDALAPAERAATGALQQLGPPLRTLATVSVRLRAAAALLPRTVSRINSTLSAGVPVLDALPRFSTVLRGALVTLTTFSRTPSTPGSLRKLDDALLAANPLLELFAPAQLYCNVLGLDGRNFSSAWGTLGNGVGPSVVVAGVVTAGAIGEELQSPSPAPDLHINYLPHENAQECESGNEPYSVNSQDLANPPGNQSRSVPSTSPPPGVSGLAQAAGLLNAPPGTPR